MQLIRNKPLFSSFPLLGVCRRAPVLPLLRHQAADGERPYRLHHRGGALLSERGQAHQAADRLQDTGESQTERTGQLGEREGERERMVEGERGHGRWGRFSLPVTSSSSGWLIFMADRDHISYSWPLTLHLIMESLVLSCSVHHTDRSLLCLLVTRVCVCVWFCSCNTYGTCIPFMANCISLLSKKMTL